MATTPTSPSTPILPPAQADLINSLFPALPSTIIPLQSATQPIPWPQNTAPGISTLIAEVEEAEAFLQSQPGYNKISETIDAIMSGCTGESMSLNSRNNLSQTRTNQISKIANDLAALLTDTKPFWDLSVANRAFEQHAGIFSKLTTFWYQHRNIDLVLADVVMYALPAGTGYLFTYWDTELQDIMCKALDPRNVLPIRPNSFRSLEDSKGVITKEKVPVNYIWDKYKVVVMPDSDGSALSGLLSKFKDATDDITSPIHRWSKKSKSEPKLGRIPTVTLYTRYYKDTTINPLPVPVTLGEGTFMVTANPGEKLYPNLRMTVWAGDKILYDGPSYYWHGKFPITKLTLDPKPWTWLGKAPLWDLLPLERSLNALLRVMDDHAAQVAQPGAIMDKNNVSKSQFDSFDTRRAGYKVLQNPLMGKGIQIQPPPPLDAMIPQQRDWIKQEMNELAGISDLGRMMDLKQLPSNDTVEAIIHQLTPVLRMRSRILEAFNRELSVQMIYNFTQWYTLPMRVTILGPGGITMDDFDFDPGSLLPDTDPHAGMDPMTLLQGPAPRYNRAQNFLRQFVYKISPGSLLNSAQMERSMMYAMLTRMGIMDPITLLEQLGVPNIGVDKLPDDVRTVIDRIKWCQANDLMPQVNPVGAKASGQSTPRIVSKES